MSTLDDLRWDAGHPTIIETDWNRLLTLLTTGGRVKESSYIVWIDGATINATNGTTGVVDYSGTDASTVIQAAIDALTSGGKVVLREGTYNIITTLVLDSYIMLEGTGHNTILRLENNANTTMVYADNILFSSIRNIRFDGNSGNNAIGVAVHLNNTNNILLYRLGMFDIPQVGIWLTGTVAILSYENKLVHIAVSSAIFGLDITKNSHDNTVIDFYAQDTVYGIRDRGGGNDYEFPHVFRSTGDNIRVESGENTFIGGFSEYSDNHGFWICGAKNKFIGCKAFNNGQAFANVWDGLLLVDASGTIITNGHFTDMQGVKTQRHGISMFGGTNYGIVTSNVVRGNIASGILPSSGVNDIIAHNIR